MLKRIIALTICLSIFLFSCKTSDQEPEKDAGEVLKTETEPESISITEVEEIDDSADIDIDVEDVEEIDEVDEVEEIDEINEIEEIDEVEEVYDMNDEYTRSTHETEDTITVDEFNSDKAAILQTIIELDEIMSNFEYDNWRNFIDETSIEYYSNPLHLRKAQKKLPDKSIQLKGLRDYFKYVFIPSRKMSKVDEIRYISKDYIKAVEVREEDDTTVVYYYFVKKGGKWLVHLPEIE